MALLRGFVTIKATNQWNEEEMVNMLINWGVLKAELKWGKYQNVNKGEQLKSKYSSSVYSDFVKSSSAYAAIKFPFSSCINHTKETAFHYVKVPNQEVVYALGNSLVDNCLECWLQRFNYNWAVGSVHLPTWLDLHFFHCENTLNRCLEAGNIKDTSDSSRIVWENNTYLGLRF